ncbi:MAG: UDP-N-acetylmuramoyl-L-alanyl-D-glutamate--2,6-diaminopimelate ligase [Robiginitomaculum sp.]
MKLSDVLSGLDVSLKGDVNPDIFHLTSDSRRVREGSIFAALKGTLADGRDYIPQAIENGASAILSGAGLPDMPIAYIAAQNPREVYAKIAARLYAGQPKTLIAMTGTNGKSSTVEFLRQIWSLAGFEAACFGTLGIVTNKGTTPLTHTTPDATALSQTLSDMAKGGISHCGMEASSHGLDQRRLDGTVLSAVGFTNLTQDHFDYHTDAEDYFNAKARLFTRLAPKGVPAIINVDGDYGRRLEVMCRARGLDVMTVGWCGEDLRIDEVTPRSASQSLDLLYQGKRYKIELPLAGEFQVLNAVSAAGLAIKTGVEPDRVFALLEKLHGVNGRMERAGVSADGAPIFVDFAHTPDGLEKLLRGVRPHTMGRIIVVFGCGGDRDPDKRPKMGAIAEKLADMVVVTDDNPRNEDAASVRKAVMAGCPNAKEIGDRAQAISYGVSQLQKGDCLVIAGKGHESGQIVGDTIIPFRDVDVAQKALRAIS